MIDWPNDELLNAHAKTNLLRLRKTAAAKTLEQDLHMWQFLSWPRTSEAPYRYLLRSDNQSELTIVVEEDGVWKALRRG